MERERGKKRTIDKQRRDKKSKKEREREREIIIKRGIVSFEKVEDPQHCPLLRSSDINLEENKSCLKYFSRW